MALWGIRVRVICIFDKMQLFFVKCYNVRVILLLESPILQGKCIKALKHPLD